MIIVLNISFVIKKVKPLNKIAKPLCIILPQMSGYIKYFEKGGKNVLDDVLDKYNESWNKTKNTLNIKFHSMPVYDKSQGKRI